MGADTDPPLATADTADEVLIHGVLDGDEPSFRALYRRHTPRLLQLVLHLVGEPRADADDVVQETWLRAVSKLSSFRGASAFRTWLLGIGVRASRELLRRRSRRRETLGLDGCEPPARAAPAAGYGDLERALGTLSERHRTVLLLHDVEGFTHEEIGAQLGIAAGTSKANLFHARRAMRVALESPREAANDSTA